MARHDRNQPSGSEVRGSEVRGSEVRGSALHAGGPHVASAAELNQILEGHSAEIAEIVQLLRSEIRQAFEGVEEWADAGYGLLAYGRSMKMADLAFAIIPHRNHVNLQLADGAELPDPAGIVEGTGKRIRHVKNRTREDVTRPAQRALIEEQIRRKGS